MSLVSDMDWQANALTDDSRQNLGNVALEDIIRSVVGASCFLVDENELLTTVVAEQGGCWVDHERGSSNDEGLRGCNAGCRFRPDLLVQAFAVKDNVGSDNTPAVAAVDTGGVQEGLPIGCLSAGHTVVISQIAMHLQHLPTACHLVEAVDILGDDSGQLAHIFQLFEGNVRSVWLRLIIDEVVADVVGEVTRMVHQKVVG